MRRAENAVRGKNRASPPNGIRIATRLRKIAPNRIKRTQKRMSEIASKANSRPSSGLVQPLVKKGGDPAHEVLFAALFGGVVAAETDADPMACGLATVNADADTDANSDEDSDILAAMQAVAAMMSGQRSMGRYSGSEAVAASPSDAVLADEGDQVGIDVIAFQAGQAGAQFTSGGTAEHLGRIQHMALWWGGWKVHRSHSQRRRRW